MQPNDPPRGEVEVREALLAAAARLFEADDPGTVSLRRIADEAGVNYGLVHRHLGSKLDVVAATVRRYSDAYTPSATATADPMALLLEMARHYLGGPAVARTLAWASLAGGDPERLVAGLTDVSELVRQLEGSADDPVQAQRFFAFAAAAVLGLGVFGEIGLAAAGAPHDQADVDALTNQGADWLVQLARHLGLDTDETGDR